jgi:hypothetical protein
MEVPKNFIRIVILLDEAFKYGDSAKYWRYVGTNIELLCVDVCNFVQRHIFLTYFS